MMGHLLILVGASAAPPGGGLQQLLVPMAIVMGVFYFLVLRPDAKRRKQHQDMLAGLKAGDKIITTGGLFATILSVQEATLQVRLGDKVKVTILRSAVAARQPEGATKTGEERS